MPSSDSPVFKGEWETDPSPQHLKHPHKEDSIIWGLDFGPLVYGNPIEVLITQPVPLPWTPQLPGGALKRSYKIMGAVQGL